uniref:Sn1-specific diacylglycerol lipase alpha n=1 Tax=Cajanus cajan TaxID=3821 RepID=A0A151RQN7_CAJCA|nr:Sn1-specific diacylglycerol lipase alpha [Cajanus cajan]
MAGKNKKKRCILCKVVEKFASNLKRRPAEAPNDFKDIVLSLAKAVRFCYAETLGKWPVLDPPRVLIYTALNDKGKKIVAMECGQTSDCVQLKDPEMLKDLYQIKRCLTRTMLVSKKRFRAKLFAAGFVKEDVLLRKRRARILKPAFTVILDKEAKCLLVLIRGTCSLTDTLTDAMGAPVSFEHKFICSDGEVRRNTISGHAHRGMVSAADWIRKRCTHILIIVGHSLGGGTAALLTYKLREINELSSCTCDTFGPGMNKISSGHIICFITSIINGCDIVLTLSASSIHDFISEGRTKRKIFLKDVRRSINAFGSRLVTRDTKVGLKNKQRTPSWFLWTRCEKTLALPQSKSENLDETSQSSKPCYESLLTQELILESASDEDECNSSNEESDHDDTDEEKQITSSTQNITTPTNCSISIDELLKKLKELELEARDDIPSIHAKEKETSTTKDTVEEINMVVHYEESVGTVTTPKTLDRHLYPPGRIMHIVPAPLIENSDTNDNDLDEKHVYLYETSKELYEKLILSRRMILDHTMKKYLKVLQQLINQLEKEKIQCGGS